MVPASILTLGVHYLLVYSATTSRDRSWDPGAASEGSVIAVLTRRHPGSCLKGSAPLGALYKFSPKSPKQVPFIYSRRKCRHGDPTFWVMGPRQGGMPETMVCRILPFKGSSGPAVCKIMEFWPIV